jgi:hypothetical protein
MFERTILKIVKRKIQQEEQENEIVNPYPVLAIGIQTRMDKKKQGRSHQELYREGKFINLDDVEDIA